ncbi:MAG: Pycsar system effector family protein [Nostoc sp.]|uniref:Pycsar system effector family protein n=1 Tax=Nostoc sp. TaxID=1180 RepID=UPI002FF008A6
MNEMTNKLMTILLMVNDWLKFAEAKNNNLLGFSGIGITVTITYLSAVPKIPISIQVGILVTAFLLSICALICSLSFLPKTDLEVIVWKKKKPGRQSKGQPSDNDNFHFFGHLYKYQEHELLDSLNRLYFGNTIPDFDKKEHQDLANQITVNSEITYLKFQIFSWALYFLIASITSISICILINLIIFHSI